MIKYVFEAMRMNEINIEEVYKRQAYCLTIARNLAIDRSQKMEAQNLQLTSEVREMPDTLTPYDLSLIHI